MIGLTNRWAQVVRDCQGGPEQPHSLPDFGPPASRAVDTERLAARQSPKPPVFPPTLVCMLAYLFLSSWTAALQGSASSHVQLSVRPRELQMLSVLLSPDNVVSIHGMCQYAVDCQRGLTGSKMTEPSSILATTNMCGEASHHHRKELRAG